jgi:hypothetical protein
VVRLALALPLQSPRSIIAVLHLVIFLLRTVGKTELNLLEDETAARRPRRPGEISAVLFVGADIALAPDDSAGRAAFEHTLRARVEREYLRQGMRDVRYDLQLL